MQLSALPFLSPPLLSSPPPPPPPPKIKTYRKVSMPRNSRAQWFEVRDPCAAVLQWHGEGNLSGRNVSLSGALRLGSFVGERIVEKVDANVHEEVTRIARLIQGARRLAADEAGVAKRVQVDFDVWWRGGRVRLRLEKARFVVEVDLTEALKSKRKTNRQSRGWGNSRIMHYDEAILNFLLFEKKLWQIGRPAPQGRGSRSLVLIAFAVKRSKKETDRNESLEEASSEWLTRSASAGPWRN